MRGVDDRGVDHHVVVDELRRPRRIRQDPADRARHQEHVFGAVGPEPVVDRRLIPQIQLLAGCREQTPVAGITQLPQDGGSDQAAMPGHENTRILVHQWLR